MGLVLEAQDRAQGKATAEEDPGFFPGPGNCIPGGHHPLPHRAVEGRSAGEGTQEKHDQRLAADSPGYVLPGDRLGDLLEAQPVEESPLLQGPESRTGAFQGGLGQSIGGGQGHLGDAVIPASED
ncbi:unnamed protein product, partial [marine sediment metagenome]